MNESKSRKYLVRRLRERLGKKFKRWSWFVARHSLAFVLGAAAVNIDKILDRVLWPGEWDRWLKMIAIAFGQ